MSKDKTPRWRQEYTGEPYTVALEWYRSRGLFNGLIPSAIDSQQERLEAAVLCTLARPSVVPAPEPRPGTCFGMEGVTPDADALELRPARKDLAQLLARILPARTPHAIVGVPGLRPRTRSRTGLTLAGAGMHALISVHVGSAEAKQALRAAEALITGLQMEPLWDSDHLHVDEDAAWERLVAALAGEETLWSTALRRIGLFTRGPAPNWSQRSPAPSEVAGHKANKLAARPVGPGGSALEGRGVVAVTAGDGRGGRGCTTATLMLGAALARGGSRVALITDADDPNGLMRASNTVPPAHSTWHDLPGLHVGGRVRVAALPAQRGTFVAQAREVADVVVIDTWLGNRDRHLVSCADVVLALVRYPNKAWTDVTVVDHRPEWVQFLAWLDERYRPAASRQQLATPLQQLVTFLEVQFAWYVLERGTIGGDSDDVDSVDEVLDAAVYDESDAGDINGWWSDYGHPSLEAPDLADLADDDTVDLRAWQDNFLTFLHTEGRQRHPQHWQQACDQWQARSLARTIRGVIQAAQHDNPQARDQFLDEIADDAVARWGATLWEQQHPVWAAAREAGDDLLSPWAHHLDRVVRSRPADEIAQELITGLHELDGVRTIIALADLTQPVSRHRLDDVREALRERGIADLVVIPRLAALRGWAGQLEVPAQPGGAVAGAANRLAYSVTAALGRRRPGTH